MITAKQYNELRIQEQQGQEIVNYNMMKEVKQMAENAAKKKSKVKMTLDGYYFDGKISWAIYKTESGMTVMKKEKKNVH